MTPYHQRLQAGAYTATPKAEPKPATKDKPKAKTKP